MREDRIAEQVTDALRLVALPPEWADRMLVEAEREADAERDAVSTRVVAMKADVTAAEGQLERLMTAYVEGVLDLT